MTYVLTPPESHVELSVQALAAGTHVFCEKPLCLDSAALTRLSQAVRESEREFMVGLCFRFHLGVEALYQLAVREGRVGRPLSVRAFMGENLPNVRPDYLSLAAPRQLGVFDLIHDVDLAIWFAGGAPVETFIMQRNYSDIGIGGPDLAEVLMDFDSGCIASVHLDYFLKPRRRYLEVIGEEGVARLEYGDWGVYTIATLLGSGSSWEVEEHTTERNKMFQDENLHFLAAVIGAAPVEVGLEAGSMTVPVLEQLLSSRSGRSSLVSTRSAGGQG